MPSTQPRRNKSGERTPWPERVVIAFLALPLLIPFIGAAGIVLAESGMTSLPFVLSVTVFQRTLLFQFFTQVATVAYGVLVWKHRRFAPFWTVTHAWLLMAGAIVLFSVFFAVDVRAALLSFPGRTDGILFLAHVGVYTLLCTWVVRSRLTFWLLLRVVFASGAGTLATLFAAPLFLDPTLRAEGFRAAIDAVLGNSNFLAHFFLLLLAWSAYALWTSQMPWRRALPVIFLSGIVLTTSSTALVLALAVMFVLIWRSWRWPAYALTILGISITIAIVSAGGAPVETRLHAATSSLAVRSQIWSQAASILLRERPLFGYGWENQFALWNDRQRDVFAATYRPDSQSSYDRMHNAPLEALIAMGLVGGLIFIVAIGRFLFVSLRLAAKTRDPAHEALALVFFVQAIFVTMNFDTLMSYILMSLAVTGWVLHSQELKKTLVWSQREAVLAGALAITLAGVVSAVTTLRPYIAATHHAQVLALLARTSDSWSSKHHEQILEHVDRSRALLWPYVALEVEIADSLSRYGMERARSPEDRAQAYVRIARGYDRVLAAHPSNPQFWHRRAVIEDAFTGDVPTTIAFLDRAVALTPNDGVLRFQFAQYYLAHEQYNEAMPIFVALRDAGMFPGATAFHQSIVFYAQGNDREGDRAVREGYQQYDPTAKEWRLLLAVYRSAHSDAQALDWMMRISALSGDKTDTLLTQEAVLLARTLKETDQEAILVERLHRRGYVMEETLQGLRVIRVQ
jgi:O-antigen ligase